MAYFAKLGKGNKVQRVEKVSNDTAINEQVGIDFLNNLYKTNDIWLKTSYNTRGGVHLLDGTPFRKNYAGIGYTYDEARDAFISPKPYASWTLNEDSCFWKPPVAYPTDGQIYSWNETNQNWQLR